jgi:tetratricopeptide (TPR) repeat protein
MKEVDSIFNQHDADKIAEIETRLESLSWNSQTLALGQRLARYQDQRGWRDKAHRTFAFMLKQAGGERFSFFAAHHELEIGQRIAIAKLNLDLAEIAFRWNEPFYHYLKIVHRLNQELNDWQLEGRYQRMTALYIVLLGSNESAQIAANRAMAIYQEHNDQAGQSLLANTLAYILLIGRQYEKALLYTRQVLEKNPTQVDSKVLADALLNHGYALRRISKGNDLSALQYYQQAVDIHHQRRDPLEFGRACASLGALYDTLGEYDRSLSCLRQGLNSMAQVGILDQAGYLFNNLMVLRAHWGAAAPPLSDFHTYVWGWLDNYQECLLNTSDRIQKVKLFTASTKDLIKILDDADRQKVLEKLAQIIARADLPRLAEAAESCELLLRSGADPLPILSLLLNRFLELVTKWGQFVNICMQIASQDPEWSDETELDFDAILDEHYLQASSAMPEIDQITPALSRLGAILILALSLSMEARSQARQMHPLREQISQLASTHQEIETLDSLLSILDDEEILVLRPGMGRGYRVRIRGIADNFQLHLLLADALIGDPAQGWLPGQRPDPRLIAAYKDAAPDPDCSVALGAFNLLNWEALQPDGFFSSDPNHWIWGEGVPADIHAFEGQRVILLAPPPYQRSWTVGRRYPDLVAELIVLETLPATRVEKYKELFIQKGKLS